MKLILGDLDALYISKYLSYGIDPQNAGYYLPIYFNVGYYKFPVVLRPRFSPYER